MPTFLLPVTRRSLPFATSLLHFSSRFSSPLAPPVQFLISSTSRDLAHSLRSQLPSLLFSSHEHESIPDYSDPKDLKEALGGCDAVVLAASGCGDDVVNLPSNPADEWLQCEQNVASLVSRDHLVAKLSWTEGFVGERSPSAIGRATWQVERELKLRLGGGEGDGDGWARNLLVLRTPTGMDAFLRGRLFDLVCGRTLSTSVKRGRVAFVHPLDVAETLSALLLQKEKDVAKLLSEGIGDKVNYSHFPLWAVQPARWVRGVPGDAIEEELAVVRALESGAQEKVDTQVLEKVLGRKPRSFREFVAENADAWPRADPL
ncbi:hypothetical protein PHYSODRAFT_559267 [Phytophthora sojae]|uniref:NAD(P)-binding domain-containing protein n=1 Tax=Phytophthora sojae (strain P6497) TaxID=1094619 RepID=G4ZED6_PHYSP|nr:hypothetical protein PHYSODRAFT_559267 [Phytophthora sojae]EGZ18401.1 hypothetical protein PHYSODRAFT_559267 [Phytophthora sojae]|eukprot:XP_009527459.1 hypothetical protein PHYSODRAFT_559267 [Phytophthora sojae]